MRIAVIHVDKLVPSADAADPKASKAPSKGKASATSDEPKPVSGEARMDMIPFMYPGSLTSTQRCFISTLVPRPGTIESVEEAAANEKKSVTHDNATDGEDEAKSVDFRVFE